jgi:hypothetical protein
MMHACELAILKTILIPPKPVSENGEQDGYREKRGKASEPEGGSRGKTAKGGEVAGLWPHTPLQK